MLIVQVNDQMIMPECGKLEKYSYGNYTYAGMYCHYLAVNVCSQQRDDLLCLAEKYFQQAMFLKKLCSYSRTCARNFEDHVLNFRAHMKIGGFGPFGQPYEDTSSNF